VAITLFPSRGCFGPLRRFRRPRLAAQPVAVALEVVDLTVVEQAVDQRRGECRVVEHATPFGQAFVGSDQRGFPFIPGGDDFVEDGADVGVGGELAELIADEDGAGVIGLEDLGAAVETRRSQDACEQRLHRGEAHGVAALEQREADRNAEVGLAQARGADQDQRPPLRDEAFVEVAEKDLAIELGAQPEVEVVEGLLEREGGVLEPPAQLVAG
jgi:hypothetical protein